MERVPNHLSAKKANLGAKTKLEDLVLDWGSESTSSKSASMKEDEQILEALEPHVNLKTLRIRGYRGGQFPLWMTKMENLTEIEISECPNCTHLPPIGGLPRLRFLSLSDLDALEYINGGDEIGVFANLEKLLIKNCEMLILPPLSLSALQYLSITNCSMLTLSSFSNCKLQNLTYLYLGFGKINNDTTRRRWNIPEDPSESLYNLKELEIHGAGQCQAFPQKRFVGLKSLTKLELWRCKIGSSFPEGWLRHLTALEELTILSCSELVEMGEEIRYLRLLRRLTLINVDEIVSLPQGLQHIPTLQNLTLRNLHRLTSLPDWLGNLTSLTELRISNCPQLPSLPSTIKEMTNLEVLSIYYCPQLKRRCEKEKGEDWHIIAHIPRLYIRP